jgi:uncharacterized protein (TIGR02271 family)
MTTFTAMYESREEAERVQAQLQQLGIIDTDGMNIRDQSSQGFSSDMKDMFIPDEDRHTYEEGVRRGHFLLTVNTTDQNADRVHDILENSNAVDVDEKASSWKSEGWSPPATSGAAAYGATSSSDGGTASAYGATSSSAQSGLGSSERNFASESRDEQSIPIVQEQLAVGKREVSRGGVRVRSYVKETPVQEQVNLREEHVHVERHPVDQPLRAGELGGDAFQERSIELTETAEEAVVAKSARVVEEVTVSKDVDQRTETVSDTVRSTEVDIDRIEGSERSTDTDRGALFGSGESMSDLDRQEQLRQTRQSTDTDFNR